MNDHIPQLAGYGEAALAKAFAALAEEVRASAAQMLQEEFRLHWLGRKQGRLKLISDAWLKTAPADARKSLGMKFNELKQQIESSLDTATTIEVGDALDITLPGTRRTIGIEHPLTKTSREIVAIFQAMGYSIAAGPEVETDYYNFESLNFPPNHPARDTQDTLVIADQEKKPLRERLLMRTHTSPVQIRTMELEKPPLRIVIPGKVYRNEAEDATHLATFQQVEGLCVDTNITFSDLKGTLDHAMKALFGASVKTRFFPSFFPFTEPSADMQISCIFCGGKGCRKCKHSGWIELLGCGMVDPSVFGFVHYDPKKYTGFAFGVGVERIAMMQYGVSDIGNFYSNDMRFLEQFA
jgi:phenylalanyl-tRNA synthetase alpha chain